MLSKIYYGFGAVLVGGYMLSSLLNMFTPSVAPKSQTLGKMRMERGKYVYVPPSTYPSSSSSSRSSSSSSSSSTRSYPSSGGFSGGK